MISLCARRGEKEGPGALATGRAVSPAIDLSPLGWRPPHRWLGSNLSPRRQPKNARINCSVSALADVRDTATFAGRG
jgi:hypothetical protein